MGCETELQVPREPRKEGFLPEEPCTWMGPMLCTSLSVQISLQQIDTATMEQSAALLPPLYHFSGLQRERLWVYF